MESREELTNTPVHKQQFVCVCVGPFVSIFCYCLGAWDLLAVDYCEKWIGH